MTDLRTIDLAILYPNHQNREELPLTPKGYKPIKVSNDNETLYHSIGEFAIFPSTEEKFNRMKDSDSNQDFKAYLRS